MKDKTNWLRLVFWVGVVVDAAAALMLMFPELNTLMTGLPAAADSPMYRNTNATAAGLMWGWTVLLAWGAQKPLERRGVMGITLFPVLSWLIGERLIGILQGQIDLAHNIPLLVLQISIFSLGVFSLWVNRKVTI